MTNQRLEKLYEGKALEEAKRVRNRIKAGKMPSSTREKRKVGVKRKSDGKLVGVNVEIWYDTVRIFADAAS